MNDTLPVVVECFNCKMNQVFLFPRTDLLTVLECQICNQQGVIYEDKLIPINDIEDLSLLDKRSAKEYLIDVIVKHSYKEFEKYIRTRYSSQKKTSKKRKMEKLTVNSAMSIVDRMYSRDEEGLREIEDDYYRVGIEVTNIRRDQQEIPKDLQEQFKALKFLYETFKKFVEQ